MPSFSPIENIDHTNAETIEREPGPVLSYKQKDQDVALLNIAHVGLRVRSERGAAFRCMGLFQDLDAAKKHYASLPDDGFETIAHKCRAWKLIPSTPPADTAAENARVEAILRVDEKRQAAKLAEFKKRHEEKAEFKNPHEQKVKASEWSAVEAKAATENRGVAGQDYVCIGVVREDVKKAALVMFLAAFSTEAECRRYARDTAAPRHKHVDLFCVRTGEWVLVDDAYKCENWGFRHKKLDDFFQQRLKDNLEAERFASRCYEDPAEKPRKMIADAK